MKAKIRSKFLAFTLVISMTIGMLPIVVPQSVSAATYQYNTGHRDTVATSLSSDAVSYYQNNYKSGFSYESTFNSLDKAALKTELESLMTRTMQHSVSYSSLTTYWPYTDAEDGKAGTVLFYSDEYSESFNREHVWPKSRASFYQSGGGADLHHLRPTNTQVNSTRSNHTMGNVKAQLSNYKTVTYSGKTVGWYDTAGNGLFEPLDNVKGDVARIYLYVYVRWDEPNLFTQDSSKQQAGDDNDGKPVIESLQTLLQWMQQDPVDTWEMSRNDLTEDIQGNRNVFIDYPELAWDLFGLDAPAGYATPSNGSGTSTPTPSSEPGTSPAPSTSPNPSTSPAPTSTPDTSNGSFTTVTDLNTLETGDSVVLYDSANNKTLLPSIDSNWWRCNNGNTETAASMFKVAKEGSSIYLTNSSGQYVYSSAAKSIALSASNKTPITYDSKTGKINLGASLLCFNTGNTAYRPYASADGNATIAANVQVKKFVDSTVPSPSPSTDPSPSPSTSPDPSPSPSPSTSPDPSPSPSPSTSPNPSPSPSPSTSPDPSPSPSMDPSPSPSTSPDPSPSPSTDPSPSPSTSPNPSPSPSTDPSPSPSTSPNPSPSPSPGGPSGDGGGGGYIPSEPTATPAPSTAPSPTPKPDIPAPGNDDSKSGDIIAGEITNNGKLVDSEGDVIKNSVVLVKDKDMYYAGEKGVPVKNKLVKVDNKTLYYATKTGKLAVSKVVTEKSGNKYFATDTGKLAVSKLVTASNGTKYYASKNGKLVTSKWVTVKNVKYYCSASGKITKSVKIKK